mmetsp:Transcript_52490/g.139765  ORF Transcript_52490/g.139765 Transcript_52490/m.139765 type:complete len:251 (-) Transcript_52490:1071-1823(-)
MIILAGAPWTRGLGAGGSGTEFARSAPALVEIGSSCELPSTGWSCVGELVRSTPFGAALLAGENPKPREGDVLTLTGLRSKSWPASRGVLPREGKSHTFRVLSLEAVINRLGASSHIMAVMSSLCAWMTNVDSPFSTSKTPTVPFGKLARISREDETQASAVGAATMFRICPDERDQCEVPLDITANNARPSLYPVKSVLLTESKSSAVILFVPKISLFSGKVQIRCTGNERSQTNTLPVTRPVNRRLEA